MWKVALFLCVGGLLHLTATECPSIKCITSDTREICEERGLYYKDNVRFNGCCPGCVSLPGLNDTCSGDCAPGYTCADQTNGVKLCSLDKTQECEYKRQTTANEEWKPDCMPDGSYAPKQCKGEQMAGRCFCYSPKGSRIFGEELWQNAANMTCGCSRFVYEAMQIRSDVTIHCNDLGNYELLQCDSGVCWCADEMTGIPYSNVVPQTMLPFLPCYNPDEHGNQYLRQCDSLRISQEKVRKILQSHGTNNVYFTPVACNYDGSYSRVQIHNGKKVCVSKDGNTLTEYTTDVSDETTNCNCEYDHNIFGNSFLYQCKQNGNYEEQQHDGANTFCVDQDGVSIKCPSKP